MPRLRVEFDAGWTNEKMRMVSVRLQRDLAAYGGISGFSGITRVDAPAEAPPTKLQFECKWNIFGRGPCDAKWESDVFTECPKGHGRKFVHKVGQPEPQEVAVAD